MKSEIENSDITYVLFGREAIKLYNMSIKMLTNAIDVNYKVGAYVSVKNFVAETKLWDDFLEISKEDFLEIRRASNQCNTVQNPERKGLFLKFFKS